MRNLRLEISYDGTRYRGWQRLPGVENTIQGKLEQTLSRILDEEIEISGSGRTDAGAHALGQVANFHCRSAMPAEEILCQLRRYLPEDIGIYSCSEASERFHARLNAKDKTYRYRIWNSDAPCVFDRRYVAVMPEVLDLDAMKAAAAHLCGEHDFSAFCGNAKMKKSTVRFIRSIEIKVHGEELRLYFTGNGFLHNMVRILVGTVLDLQDGVLEGTPASVLEAKDRSAAGRTMPPTGLCLKKVFY